MDNDQSDLETLREQYLMATRKLSRVRSKAKRRELREYINDLKINLGWSLLEYGKYEQGYALYESLPWRGYGEAKCNGMAWALIETGHYDEAKRLLESGLNKFPQSYALGVAMGALYDSLGDNFEALKCVETALQFAHEDNAWGQYNKASTLMKLGCYGDAQPIIDDLIERYPEDPTYLAEKGFLALNTGYSQEALQYYQKAMEIWQLNPTVYTGICIYTGLCTTYMELEIKREGMEIALEGIKRFPDQDPVLYRNAGSTFYRMGWRNECIEILRKGAERFPNDEKLKKFIKDVEDDSDDPNGDEKPPLLTLLLLMALIYKKRKRK